MPVSDSCMELQTVTPWNLGQDLEGSPSPLLQLSQGQEPQVRPKALNSSSEGHVIPNFQQRLERPRLWEPC